MQPKTDSVALLDVPDTPTRANAVRVDESGSDPSATPAPQKIGFVSLGCPKNLVDSEVMMGLLSQSGAQITARAEDADIIVVNTCSFIESAKQESVDAILEMAQHKTDGTAPSPTCRTISTTRTRRACWLRQSTRRTSRSPKAAIIRARSASFLN